LISRLYTPLKFWTDTILIRCNITQPVVISLFYFDMATLYLFFQFGIVEYLQYPIKDCVRRKHSVVEHAAWVIVDGTEYESWVCSIVSTLILDCYKTEKNLLNLKGSDSFYSSFAGLASLRYDIAELLFPIICYDIVSTNGPGERTDFISEKISTVLLSEKARAVMPQAVRLGIKTLTFILKQAIHKFVSEGGAATGKKRKPLEPQKSSSSNSEKKTLLYDFPLNIDFFYAAKAALDCGCVCSAMMFYELNLENSRYSEIVTPRSNEEMTALLEILLSTHDFDAVHSINQSHSLEMQSAIYAHNENWLEALSTYESILQSKGSSSAPHPEVATALEGLGCYQLLSNYLSSSSLLDGQGKSSSETDLGYVGSLTQNGRTRTGMSTNNYSRRNQSNSIRYNSSSSSEGSSSCVADSALRSWSNELSGSKMTDFKDGNEFGDYAAFSIRLLADNQTSGLVRTLLTCSNLIHDSIIDVNSHESAKR
jgi:hypothetical protein